MKSEKTLVRNALRHLVNLTGYAEVARQLQALHVAEIKERIADGDYNDQNKTGLDVVSDAVLREWQAGLGSKTDGQSIWLGLDT